MISASLRRASELQELVSKRRQLEIDASAMELEANKLADKAENTLQLTLLAKSNALRRGAVSKRAEIKEMDAVIAEHE